MIVQGCAVGVATCTEYVTVLVCNGGTIFFQGRTPFLNDIPGHAGDGGDDC